MRPARLLALTLSIASLGLAGCDDDPADSLECRIGFVDGGDGACVPGGTCSEGYRHAGNWTCVSEDGPCPDGYATSGRNDLCCAIGYHDGGDGTCVRDGTCSPGYVEDDGECVTESREPSGLGVPEYVTAGESYTASFEYPVATSTYAWTITGGTLETNSGVSVVFTAGSSGTVTLSCVETDQAGTPGEARTATSTIVPMPVIPEIEVSENVVAWESYTASVKNPVATSTYAWTITGGTLQSDSGASVVFTAGNSGTVTLSCVETNQAGTTGESGTATRSFVPEIGVATQVAAGDSHACALKTDGGVSCWGNNSDGQLGDGTSTSSAAPVEVTGLSNTVGSIVAGAHHTCALETTGGVSCWGANSQGQLGNGTTTGSATPVEVTGLSSGVAAIAANGSHTCALTTSGGISCWGYNFHGQLGNGTTTSSAAPVEVTGLSAGVAAITAGNSHTCALMTSGAVWCWGDNFYGQFGNGTDASSTTPVEVTGLSSGVAAIAAGGRHTCALMTNGGVSCWGNDLNGQLGNGTATSSTTPTEVKGLSSGVAIIATSGDHTCAVMTSGGVSCWGDDRSGQLGDGKTAGSTSPVGVAGLSVGVVTIATGERHTCAVTTIGGVSCWGDNHSGQLGKAMIIGSTIPVETTGLSGGATIAAGDHHVCAVTANGGASCWGGGAFGELGNGTATDSDIPVEVTGLSSGVAAITTGGLHTCALRTDGDVACWGNNYVGQLGSKTPSQSATPRTVTSLSEGVAAIAAGNEHTCVLKTDGGVACWGDNFAGKLGNGTTTGSDAPVDVTGLSSGVAAIGAGGHHTCALTTSGGVLCWGYNSDGRLGDGTTTDRWTPVEVTGLSSDVAAIAVGGSHTCALMANGGVSCWGGNINGQLGNGTIASSSVPVGVTGLSDGVAAIAAGSYTCALKTDGGVSCWGGNNFHGELGNGTTISSTIPVEVKGLSGGIAAMVVGGSHACVLKTNGRVLCWGNNHFGALGVPVFSESSTPVEVRGLSSASP